ncbi:hypothetical protein E2C01_038223 [Portunus trituberculatus]|uniref:Uncharacterized protein n=1 Tax=Portunus trituberculatus TaxID=210409 RepID=A0A5B7FGZ7_PORTR|nr:hypothetical protein [Portunus trituberculatus]
MWSKEVGRRGRARVGGGRAAPQQGAAVVVAAAATVVVVVVVVVVVALVVVIVAGVVALRAGLMPNLHRAAMCCSSKRRLNTLPQRLFVHSTLSVHLQYS